MDVLPAAWTVVVIARLKVQSVDGRILILWLAFGKIPEYLKETRNNTPPSAEDQNPSAPEF
jgi:hypothetical protein